MSHNLAACTKEERGRINLDLLALGVATEPTDTMSEKWKQLKTSPKGIPRRNQSPALYRAVCQ